MDKLIRELKEENDRLKKMMEGGDLSALLAAAPAGGAAAPSGGGGGAVMTDEGEWYSFLLKDVCFFSLLSEIETWITIFTFFPIFLFFCFQRRFDYFLWL